MEASTKVFSDESTRISSLPRTIFQNETIENIEFYFYQETEVVFIGNILRNVSIFINGVTNVTIISNQFLNPADISIIVWNCITVNIVNNLFDNSLESAIQIYQTSESIVSNNKVILSQVNTNTFALHIGILIDQ